MGINGMYMMVAVMAITKFAMAPVFMAPSSFLAAKRMAQKGKTAARRVK